MVFAKGKGERTSLTNTIAATGDRAGAPRLHDTPRGALPGPMRPGATSSSTGVSPPIPNREVVTLESDRIRLGTAGLSKRGLLVAGQNPGSRLGEDPSDQAPGLPEPLRRPLELELREPHRADRARRDDVLRGALGLPDHRPGVSHELPVGLATVMSAQTLAEVPPLWHRQVASLWWSARPLEPW